MRAERTRRDMPPCGCGDGNSAVHEAWGLESYKPVMQSLYIDLLPEADAAPRPMHLGVRIGRPRGSIRKDENHRFLQP